MTSKARLFQSTLNEDTLLSIGHKYHLFVCIKNSRFETNHRQQSTNNEFSIHGANPTKSGDINHSSDFRPEYDIEWIRFANINSIY